MKMLELCLATNIIYTVYALQYDLISTFYKVDDNVPFCKKGGKG